MRQRTKSGKVIVPVVIDDALWYRVKLYSAALGITASQFTDWSLNGADIDQLAALVSARERAPAEPADQPN